MKFKAYKEMVDSFIVNSSKEVFGNFSEDCAEHIVLSFLAAAQYSVSLLCSVSDMPFLSSKALGYLLECAAIRIAKNGGKIRILALDGKSSNSLRETVDLIRKNGISNVEYLPVTYTGDTPINQFMVIDSMGYRLESPRSKGVPRDRDFIKAEVCCNGREKAAKLQEYFDSIWDRLEKVQPPTTPYTYTPRAVQAGIHIVVKL